MPYTLAKFFLWALLMALAGGIIGWLLRSLTARSQIAAVRATTVDHAELDRLRGRLANLEAVVAERDRLRMELADVRGSTAGALGFASVVEPPMIPPEPAGTGDTHDAPAGVPADTDAPADAAAEPGAAPAAGAAPEPAGADTAPPGPALDLDAARATLGRRITMDDLTVVEGIGAKIAELCAGIGVTTWRQLADTEVEQLQSMLDAAGSRFRMHRPGSWPRQAALLADGAWTEFKQLTDELGGGT